MYRIELVENFTCLMAGRVRQTHGWDHDGRKIDRRHLLVFIINGQADFCFGGHTYAAQRGDVVLIPRRSFYTARTEESCEYFFLHLLADLAEAEPPPVVPDSPRPFSFALPPRAASCVYLPPHISSGDRYPAVYARFRDCVGEASAHGPIARLAVDLDAARILVQLAAICAEARADDGLPVPLTAALTYVRTHLRRSITTAELCADAHVSPSYLARLFRRHLHTTPTAYINREKLHYARELLHHTDMTVTELAEYLAYCDVFYFSRLYKRQFGYAPSVERDHAGRGSGKP